MGLLDKEYSKPVSTSASPRSSQMKSVNRVKNLMDTRGYSMDRANRNLLQQDLYQQFKNDPTKTKLVSGTTNLYQAAQPGGMTLADKAQELAFKYGPTPKELIGDIGRGLGSMIKGGFDFMTKGGITGALFQGAKDLFTQPIDTAKRIGYGAQDMMKGYDPFTKQGIGETQKIETQPLPGLDLEAKMSAYEDPIKFYASSSKQKYPGYSDQQSQYYYGDKPKESPTGDQYLYADAGDATQNYMNLLKNVQNLGKTPYGTFGVKDVLSSPTFTYEKELGPGTLSAKIGDNKASLGYSMIFNKGGRVRGTGIMGALR